MRSHGQARASEGLAWARAGQPASDPRLALASTLGNRALGRLLARAPKRETWYRGEAPGVHRAKIGGAVHDLTDGLYLIDDQAAAQRYGDLRAAKPGGGYVVSATIDRRMLGKVLDLPVDPRWRQFVARKPPVASMGKTWAAYMAKGTELYNDAFRLFLAESRIDLKQYDAIIAEDFIRNPNARQLVIVNEKIAERIDDRLASFTEASGPSPPPRGGADSPAPNLEIENGRIKLYRAVGPEEAAAVMRHGDFEYSPHGGGKYFAFSRQDAINAGKKLYPGNATIVETTVPRAFVPSQPDVRATVQHPHIRAREPGAVMIEGEAMVFYDPRAGGWSIHVDDNALDAMNSQMSRPKIIESPLPPIGTPSRVAGGGPTGGEPNVETKAESNVEPNVVTSVEPSVEARLETRTTPDVAPGAYPIESGIHGNAVTIEGAAQALLAMQLKQMQATEAAKAYDAWERLQPKIDEARSKGRWVRVGLHLDVPEKIDVIGGVVGIGDISQIVWFRTMWIEVMETREQAYGVTNRGAPELIRSNMSAADPHQQADVPHPHTRIVATQLVLPPYPTGEKHGRTVLQQTPGFVGSYRPIAFRDVSGDEAAVKAFGMQRNLTIGDRGRDDIAMIDANDSQALWPSSTWVDTHARTANGTFYKQTEALETQYIFRSKFTYTPGGVDMLRESVQAEDTDPSWSLKSKWSATIYWAKL